VEPKRSLRIAGVHTLGWYSRALMKKPVTFRIEQNLLEQARRSAQAENRTLTNFVETLLKMKVALLDQARRPAGDQPPRKRKIGDATSDCD
jgi:hypothetical protein